MVSFSGLFQNLENTYLVTDEYRGSIRGPGEGCGVSRDFNLVDTCLGPYVPDLDSTIATDTAEFSILDGVERDLLDRSSMTFEFG